MPKQEIRIIAWDDCAFKFKDKRVQILGAIFRGGRFMDGLLSTAIKKDGMDATDRIASCVNSSRHYDQLSLIMLDGISFGGLNIVDIKLLAEKTKLPVIVVMRKMPDIDKFLGTMKKFRNYKTREQSVRNAGDVYSYRDIFYQKSFLAQEDCEQIFKIACTQSNIPEPLRVAHLIASGLSRKMNVRSKSASFANSFESRGRA